MKLASVMKLEKMAYYHTNHPGPSANHEEIQKFLDENTDEIIFHLSPEERCEAIQQVYDETADAYEAEPHHKFIIDELVEFMNLLHKPNADVLDVGCATGRDTFFMSVANTEYRESLMGRKDSNGLTTFDKFPVPQDLCRVTAIDASSNMRQLWALKFNVLVDAGLLNKDAGFPCFYQTDMHAKLPCDKGKFDGIWSCTSLFTHTPKEYLKKTIESVAQIIKTEGIFFTSYKIGLEEGGCYDKLEFSKTGHIKWFSQPDPQEVSIIARGSGFRLMSQRFGNLPDKTGKVLKEKLFVSQFFRKI